MLIRLPKCQAQGSNQFVSSGVHETTQVMIIQYQRIRARAGISKMK